MNDNDERLDQLLSAPLAPVADGGFSARVMANVSTVETREPWLETAVLAVTACVLVAVLSTAGFSEWIAGVSVTLATSLPLAIAGLALAITWSYTRALAD
ncbi:MAG TPA: hypothetical protein VKR31_12555 [Rhizomicrobium sp.]|nr:hypothetical protein [Rhizomicrobium sp.]